MILRLYPPNEHGWARWEIVEPAELERAVWTPVVIESGWTLRAPEAPYRSFDQVVPRLHEVA